MLLSPGRSEFTDTILSVHPSDVLDMPVDPNEPTYCLCHQVSYGEMIGCDNPDVSVGACRGGCWCRTRGWRWGAEGGERRGAGRAGPPFWLLCLHMEQLGDCPPPPAFQCPIEWFHFACVDLTTKPKGKWSVWGRVSSRRAGVCVCRLPPRTRRRPGLGGPCLLGSGCSWCGCGAQAMSHAVLGLQPSWQRDVCCAPRPGCVCAHACTPPPPTKRGHLRAPPLLPTCAHLHAPPPPPTRAHLRCCPARVERGADDR